MKYLLALTLAIVASIDAFVPTTTRQNGGAVTAEQSTTSLGPGFLKDLGFEKPSWLPDFGGGDKKKDEETTDAAVAVAAEDEGGEESDETEDVAEE